MPPHDKIQPDLLSGEIKVTVTAKTPIFISNGEKEDKTVDFYRGPSGEYEIPGSTMRGLIRENVQILGFGKVRTGVDVEDYRILFRDVASGRYTLSKAENIYYHNIMKVKNEQNQDDHTNYIKYGYITNNHGTYFIREIKESLRKVTRKQVKDDLFPNSELENATLIDVEYDKNKKKYYRYEKNEVTYDSSKQRGILLITGKSVTGAGKKRKEDKENSGKIKKEMKENHCYFFPEENTDTAKEKVTKEDILNYNMDYERRKSTLGDNYKFWELPKDGEKKPIFYIKHDEHTYFGMSLYFRIGYKHTIAYGLPVQKTQDGTVSPESDPLILDYVYSMFGFTSNQNQAYKSRVSFGDFQISQKKKPDKAVKYVVEAVKQFGFMLFCCVFVFIYVYTRNTKVFHFFAFLPQESFSCIVTGFMIKYIGKIPLEVWYEHSVS